MKKLNLLLWSVCYSILACSPTGGSDERVVDSRTTAQDCRMKNDLEEWLGILENTTKDQRSREDAALQIARLRDKSMVPRLLKLIPDVNQSVTVSIAHALGEIGDPRALPALRQLAEVKSLQGPYRTLVLRAIENCEKTSEKR